MLNTGVAARYGGDEFAVILPNTSLADAAVVAERIVNAVARASISWEKDDIAVSVSIGLGQYDADSSPEKAIRITARICSHIRVIRLFNYHRTQGNKCAMTYFVKRIMI